MINLDDVHVEEDKEWIMTSLKAERILVLNMRLRNPLPLLPKLRHFYGVIESKEGLRSLLTKCPDLSCLIMRLSEQHQGSNWSRVLSQVPQRVNSSWLFAGGGSTRLSNIVKSPAAEHSLIKLVILFKASTNYLNGRCFETAEGTLATRLYPMQHLMIHGKPRFDEEREDLMSFISRCTDIRTLELRDFFEDPVISQDDVDVLASLNKLEEVVLVGKRDKNSLTKAICESNRDTIKRLEIKGGRLFACTLDSIAKLPNLAQLDINCRGIGEEESRRFLMTRQTVPNVPLRITGQCYDVMTKVALELGLIL